MSIKKITLIMAVASVFCGCWDDRPSHNTNPGFVAFDYTFQTIADYSRLFAYVGRFNEYLIQTSSAQRDSIDIRYFEDIKISDYGSHWRLRGVHSDFDLQIIPHGQSLKEKGTRWDIIQTHLESGNKQFDFSIENIGNNTFRIPKHSNKNQDFEMITEWIFRLEGESTFIESSGYLLSIASPKLKLEYTITEHLISNAFGGNKDFEMYQGAIEIEATDMERKITEKTVAEILSNKRVEISYNGYRDIWNYGIRYYYP